MAGGKQCNKGVGFQWSLWVASSSGYSIILWNVSYCPYGNIISCIVRWYLIHSGRGTQTPKFLWVKRTRRWTQMSWKLIKSICQQGYSSFNLYPSCKWTDCISEILNKPWVLTRILYERSKGRISVALESFAVQSLSLCLPKLNKIFQCKPNTIDFHLL